MNDLAIKKARKKHLVGVVRQRNWKKQEGIVKDAPTGHLDWPPTEKAAPCSLSKK